MKYAKPGEKKDVNDMKPEDQPIPRVGSVRYALIILESGRKSIAKHSRESRYFSFIIFTFLGLWANQKIGEQMH